MQRVDTATAAATPPTQDPAGTPGYFTKGNPTSGTPATVPGQDFFNSVQEELIGTILAAGLTPSKADNTQLLQAIIALVRSYAATTGDVKLTLKTIADAGWVLMNDTTIGNAASGATGRANADTSALFTLLWTNTVDADCAVSTGRGGSAAADFAANKTIALPKALGRALATYGAGSGLTARALAKALGEEAHLLTSAESGVPPHEHPPATGNFYSSSGGGQFYSVQGTSTAAYNTATGANAATNAASAHNTMQPTLFLNTMIKL